MITIGELAVTDDADGGTWVWHGLSVDVAPRIGEKLELSGELAPEGWERITVRIDEVVWHGGGGSWISASFIHDPEGVDSLPKDDA